MGVGESRVPNIAFVMQINPIHQHSRHYLEEKDRSSGALPTIDDSMRLENLRQGVTEKFLLYDNGI